MFLSDEPTTVPSYQDDIPPPVTFCESLNEHYQVHYEELSIRIEIKVVLMKILSSQ
jgi:hypothetical protein